MPTLRLPGSIAIIDVETTGLFSHRHDRIIEIATVVIDRHGQIDREFVSLINPGRDIGPSSIHGLSAADVLLAPTFPQIVDHLVKSLDGIVAVAGHNVRFDLQFIANEFDRLGGPSLPSLYSICTMQLAGGGRLSECCDDYGIRFTGEAHQALTDARATAQLLSLLLPDHPELLEQLSTVGVVKWPKYPGSAGKPLTRDESRRRQAAPATFLQRLVGRVDVASDPIASDGAVMAYAALLDRALEDRHIADTEGDALVELAKKWGLTGKQIEATHRAYLDQLSIAAVADGVVADAELRDLKMVARLLGRDEDDLEATIRDAAKKVGRTSARPPAEKASGSDLKGQSVCFTGELQSKLRGQVISRESAQDLAKKAGLEVANSVTKKLDLLVVADPHTQSGKAAKAKKYGIRIMHEPVFWRAIGVTVD